MRKFLSFPIVAVTGLALLGAPGCTPPPMPRRNGSKAIARARAIINGGGNLAGIELQLPEGWKTYWRYPGEAGGVAPSFDWSKSTNLESAQVLYPAPKRFTDKSGDTIGYKGNVLFPVRLKPKDASKPIDVHLAFDYGVCKDICIPAQAELTLNARSRYRTGRVGSVRGCDGARSGTASRRGAKPIRCSSARSSSCRAPSRGILLETQFPDGAEHADAFVEAPDGLYVPLPKKVADDGKGAVTFEIDLSKDADVAALKGKQLTATIVSDKGQSEATFPLQ